MLKSADPWQGGARQTTVIDALRAGVGRVNAGSVPDPVVAATIKRTIGTVYLNLGRVPEADTLLHAALAEHLAHRPQQRGAAQSFSDLGASVLHPGKYDSAGPALERALEIRRRRLGGRDTFVAATLLDLADVADDRGDFRRSDSLAQEALRILRQAHGESIRRWPPPWDGSPGHGSTRGTASGGYDGPAAIAMLHDLGLDRTPPAAGITNDLH
jgi:tetratricopeptide (TPR) repeat protein